MKLNLKINFKMEEEMKKWICLLATCFMMALCGAFAEGGEIVTTNFPCYDFARQIAGDAAQVRMLIRPGVEVHSYEPSPADILSIGSADLFVYIGGESDVWVDGILDSFGTEAPASLKLMDSVSLLEEEEHDHDELAYDEHIWTSPRNAIAMVRAVEAALCEALPESADVFHANADAYAAELAEIDAALTEIVANGARKELVFADRFPFLYLAHDYGLSCSAAFTSCTAETEPSAQTLVKLIEIIQRDHIPVVYTIELSTGTIARTVAEETGVEILTLYSAQTVTQAQFDAGESYASLMWQNLEAIEKGLNG